MKTKKKKLIRSAKIEIFGHRIPGEINVDESLGLVKRTTEKLTKQEVRSVQKALLMASSIAGSNLSEMDVPLGFGWCYDDKKWTIVIDIKRSPYDERIQR